MKVRLAGALLCAAAGAAAEPPSPLWDDVVHPDRLRCAQRIEEGLAALERVQGVGVRFLPDAVRTMFVDTARRCPDDCDAQALLGRALFSARDYAGARLPLERARRRCPDSLDAELAFALGQVRMFQADGPADVAAALEELKRAEASGGIARRWQLAHSVGDGYMALGRLAEASAAYRRAIRLATPSATLPTASQAPARLALAVALDRAEDAARAESELALVERFDPKLRALYSDESFLVPRGDVHYYAAVMALHGRRFARARAELRAFLSVLPDSAYAPRARAHLAGIAHAIDPVELFSRGVPEARLAEALSPLVEELERCLPAVRPRLETGTRSERAPLFRVHAMHGAGGWRVDVGSPPIPAGPDGCMAAQLPRLQLPEASLDFQLDLAPL